LFADLVAEVPSEQTIVTSYGQAECCKDCLKEWFKSSKGCPICRNEPSSL
jgi:hypothetical protein